MNAIIYTLHDCPFCAAAKKYLTDHAIPFEEKDVEADKAHLEEMLQKSNGFEGVPFAEVTTDTGVISLRGFTPAEWDEKLAGKTSSPQPEVAPAPQVASSEPVSMPEAPSASVETPAPVVPTEAPVMPVVPSADMGSVSPMPAQASAPEPMDVAPMETPAQPSEPITPRDEKVDDMASQSEPTPSQMDPTVAPSPASAVSDMPTPIETVSASAAPVMDEKPADMPAGVSNGSPKSPGEDAELEEILKGLRTMTDQQAAAAPAASAPVAAMPQTEVAPTPVATLDSQAAPVMPNSDMPSSMPQQSAVTVAEGLGVGQSDAVMPTPVPQGSPMGPTDLPPIPDFQQKTS